MNKSKEPVKLRQRKMPSGNISLYLDIYRNGKREYEYLKLYLIPEKSRADKEKNRETMRLADAIRAKRVVEFRNGEYGFKDDYASETKFYDYYEAMVEERRGEKTKNNWGNWMSCLHHLRIYEKQKDITFADITTEWVQGFKDYLENRAVAWAHDTSQRKRQKLDISC